MPLITRQERLSKPGSHILCVGLTPCLQRTLSFKRFQPGEVNRAQTVLETASGKATNAARIIQTLGGAAAVMGFAGGDTGRRMLERLESQGLPSVWIQTPDPTRICQTLIDHDSGQVTELVEEAANPSAENWREFFDELEGRLAGASALVIAGSPPPGADPDVYRDILRLANRHELPAFLDAQKEFFLRALEAKPLLAKLNLAELTSTLGLENDSESRRIAAARGLIGKGAKNVLVTDGARPALWVSAMDHAWFQPTRVQAVNPIGSGDAMTGGVAHGLVSGQNWREALRLGLACGAANALTQTSGELDAAQVQKLLERV